MWGPAVRFIAEHVTWPDAVDALSKALIVLAPTLAATIAMISSIGNHILLMRHARELKENTRLTREVKNIVDANTP